MFVTITVRLAPENNDELQDAFAGSVEELKQHFEMLKSKKVFGPPELCEVRYLILGGKADA